jgi:hypothetical protein
MVRKNKIRRPKRANRLGGSLGPGRVAILQPACTASMVEIATGTQLWWARSLGQTGREALTCAAKWGDAQGRTVLGIEPSETPLPDLAVWRILCRQADARFGVSSRFDLVDANRLDVSVWLFEQRGDRLETLGEWTRRCSAPELAEGVFALLADIALRVGARLPWGDWVSAFDTGDAEAAALFLRTLGVYSLADWGLDVQSDKALDSLVDVLALAPAMEPAVTHLPAHFRLLRDSAGASPFTVARAYRRAVDAVGRVPDAWRDVDRELRGAE